MLTYEDILYSVTKILSSNFDYDVFTEDTKGDFENECFHVSIIPISSKAALKTGEESLMISIKYFGANSKIKNYQVANELKLLFNLNLKVKDRVLTISNIEPNFLTDEVGHMLDFLITIKYFDDINVTNENYEDMQDFNLNIKNEG